MTFKELACALLLSTVAITPSAVLADNAKDIELISKAISYINGGPTGDQTLDILYDPNNDESIKHADEILALTANGAGSKVKFTGKKVSSVNEATSKIIFLTRGTSVMHEPALSQAVINGGVTVSTDETCLGKGCVLIVKSEPRVDIIISTAAAFETKTEFSSAFKMLVTEK